MKTWRHLSNVLTLVTMASATIAAASASTPTYDLSRDFSAAVNPNGAWSYGYANTLGGSFVPFSSRTQTTMGAATPINIWWHPSGYPGIWRNSSNATGYGDA